jgi:hypothetical protein
MSPSAWPHCGSATLPTQALKYFKARGIDAASARRAGVRYLTAAETNAIVGKLDDDSTSHGVAFPFPGLNTGAVRFLKDDPAPKFKAPFKSQLGFYLGPFPPRSRFDWKRIQKDPRVKLYFTEGPMKGLCATSHGLPTIALNGVWGWSRDHAPITDFELFIWKDRVVVLCFDSDVVAKTEVQQALCALAAVLTGLGAQVMVKVLGETPDGVKVGIDDFIAKHGANAFKELPELSISDARFIDWGADAATQELNKLHAFIMLDGKATILTELPDPEYTGTKKIELSRTGDVELKYANQLIYGAPDPKTKKCKATSKYRIWLQDERRREARRLWLRPGVPWGINPATGDFNIWQGWAVEPREPDRNHKWERLQEHIHEVIANGNERHAKYILDWMAYGVQRPDRLPEVAIVNLGGQGSGKGILWNSYAQLYGRHAVQLVQSSQLTGNFNDHLKDKLFIFTDTDARRYAVFRVSEKRRGQLDYFRAIGNELLHGGYAAMLYDLLHRNLNGFDPRIIPLTNALLDQKKLSWDRSPPGGSRSSAMAYSGTPTRNGPAWPTAVASYMRSSSAPPHIMIAVRSKRRSAKRCANCARRSARNVA